MNQQVNSLIMNASIIVLFAVMILAIGSSAFTQKNGGQTRTQQTTFLKSYLDGLSSFPPSPGTVAATVGAGGEVTSDGQQVYLNTIY